MSEYTDTKIDLILNHLTKEKFEELKVSNLLNANELYLVDEDYLDALSNTIVNVANPILSSDAANKNYVDSISLVLSSSVQSLGTSLETLVQTTSSSLDQSITNQGNSLSTYVQGVSSSLDQNITNLGNSLSNFVHLSGNENIQNNLSIAGNLFESATSLSNKYIAATLSQDFTDPQKDQAGLNLGTRYKLILKELDSYLVSGETNLSCSIDDYSINTIPISSDEYPVTLLLPGKSPDNRARDFMIRLEITAPDVPEITFELPNNEEADFESLDNWTQIIPGVNFLSFTETKNGLIE